MSGVRRGFCIFGIFLLVGISVLAVLIAVALGRALLIEDSNDEIEVTLIDDGLLKENIDDFSRIFAESIKYKTISSAEGEYDREEILRLHQHLRTSFPHTFNSRFIEVETVNNYSLLLTIEGTNKNLKPYMLAGHMDVVPAVAEHWHLDPFLGEVISDPISGEKVIWGRGAIDDKVAVIGILSSIEMLLKSGWTPSRSFYVGFGHDEEVGGNDGAAHIAMTLHQRDVKLDFLLDEGVPITVGVMPGIPKPVALIGVTEKGAMSIRIETEGDGGHSSVPGNNQAISTLATAIHNLYQHPQPSMFGQGPEEEMLKHLAPKADWPFKFVFANIWLFRPFLPYGFSKSSESNAVIRTTTAVTMLRAGYKDNVVPANAWAHINHRIHPAQTADDVLQHDMDAIGNANVKVKVEYIKEPHPISPYGRNSMHYTLLTSVLKKVYPDIASAPGLMIGNTDTIHYMTLNLTSNVYRFGPFIVTKEELSGFHGKNERLQKSKFENVLRFFSSLILENEIILEKWESKNKKRSVEL